MKKVSATTGVLVLTAFTAGLVDVLSFAIQGRGKTDRFTVRRILAFETLIIGVCAIGSMRSTLSIPVVAIGIAFVCAGGVE